MPLCARCMGAWKAPPLMAHRPPTSLGCALHRRRDKEKEKEKRKEREEDRMQFVVKLDIDTWEQWKKVRGWGQRPQGGAGRAKAMSMEGCCSARPPATRTSQ